MEDYSSFLRPRTPEPSFDDLLSTFSNNQEQVGEGVVTRRQARLGQALPDVQLPPAVQPEPEPEPEPEQEAHVQSQAERHSDRVNQQLSPLPSSSHDDSDAPYLKDTLVAANDDVEAYCVKSFFRKMKTFA